MAIRLLACALTCSIGLVGCSFDGLYGVNVDQVSPGDSDDPGDSDAPGDFGQGDSTGPPPPPPPPSDCPVATDSIGEGWVSDLGGNIYASDVVVDEHTGNLFITGVLEGTVVLGGQPLTSEGYFSCFLASFRGEDGAFRWAKVIADANDWYWHGHQLAVDNDGNLAIAGAFGGTVDLGGGPLETPEGYGQFVASFDENGNHRWSRAMTAPDWYWNWGRGGDRLALDVDESGNVYRVGIFGGTLDLGDSTTVTSATGYGYFLASFSHHDGSVRWARGFEMEGDPTVVGWDVWWWQGASLAIDTSDNVYLVGRFWENLDLGSVQLGTGDTHHTFLASVRGADGVTQWGRSFETGWGTPGVEPYYWGWGGGAVAADSDGQIYLSGTFAETIDLGGGVLTATTPGFDNQHLVDGFLASFDSDGSHRWSQIHPGLFDWWWKASWGDQWWGGHELATDPAGNVYFLEFEEDLPEIYVTSINSNGAPRWSHRFAAGEYPWATGLAVGCDGVWTVGFFENGTGLIIGEQTMDSLPQENTWVRSFLVKLGDW
ncbi:hypothetical protein ACFL6C_08580 [Myxococcota bacterium]